MAAMRMMAASMPLHPASMETLKPLAVFCRSLPEAATRASNRVMSPGADARQRLGPREDEGVLHGRRQLGSEQRDQDHDEQNEEAHHQIVRLFMCRRICGAAATIGCFRPRIAAKPKIASIPASRIIAHSERVGIAPPEMGMTPVTTSVAVAGAGLLPLLVTSAPAGIVLT